MVLPGAAQSCEIESAVHASPAALRCRRAQSDPQAPDLDAIAFTTRGDSGSIEALKATLDGLDTPVALLDLDGRIVLINAAWCRDLHGASDTDRRCIGAPYSALRFVASLHDTDARVLRNGVRAVLNGEMPAFEHIVRSAGAGEEHWYRIKVAQLTIQRAKRALVTHEDITAVHAAQAAVGELWQRLVTIQDDERRRIAAELHDSTVQQLTAAALYLQSLGRKLKRNPRAQQTLAEVQQTICEAQKEIHTLSYLLNPPYLDRDGLARTLRSFIDGFSRRSGLETRLEVTSLVDELQPELQLALLRIVQEALSNVHRHAAASRVRVKFKAEHAQLHFYIADDGHGRPRDLSSPSTRPGSGLGVAGMQARIRKLGGAIRIRSGQHGTTVHGKVPLARDADGASLALDAEGSTVVD